MAALETPWMTSMDLVDGNDGSALALGEDPTYAAFAPTSASSYSSQRSTILIHQKSPLLLATPPQVTRALAYSHPFIVPLNKLFGLLSWSTDDPWESFLLLAAFWAVALYGDIVLRFAGPLVLVIGLILGMYARHWSSLSTSSNPANHARNSSDPAINITQGKAAHHHKSLDDIVNTLQVFTRRSNILLTPFIQLTDFLSTQITATSSSVTPALTTLFLRLFVLSPIWYAFTLSPLYIITTKRIVVTIGTMALTWHSKPARISRVIIWRSRTVRRVSALVTGLQFSGADMRNKENRLVSLTSTHAKARALARTASSKTLNAQFRAQARGAGPMSVSDDFRDGIKFPFVLFENQRRWLGLGWTPSMLAYERAAWTDEELNPTKSKDEFELPRVDGGLARWHWCEDDWHLAPDEDDDTAKIPTPYGPDDDKTWIYTDTKWRFPRLGKDGWGKYTRRRKWVRAAELVDASPSIAAKTSSPSSGLSRLNLSASSAAKDGDMLHVNGNAKSGDTVKILAEAAPQAPPSPAKKSWFSRSKASTNSVTTLSSNGAASTPIPGAVKAGSMSISSSLESHEGGDDDGYIPLRYRGRQGPTAMTDGDAWGVGEDVGMALG